MPDREPSERMDPCPPAPFSRPTRSERSAFWKSFGRFPLMSEDLRAKIAAGTAIFRGERILFRHRSLQGSNPGIWDLPGGHVADRESISGAAKRETREEAGFDVRLGSVFHVEVFHSLSKKGKIRPTVGIYHHCTAPTRKTPQVDPDEPTEYAWASLEDRNSYPTLPFLDRTIQAAFRTRTVPDRSRAGVSRVRDWGRDPSTSPVPE